MDLDGESLDQQMGNVNDKEAERRRWERCPEKPSYWCEKVAREWARKVREERAKVKIEMKEGKMNMTGMDRREPCGSSNVTTTMMLRSNPQMLLLMPSNWKLCQQ